MSDKYVTAYKGNYYHGTIETITIERAGPMFATHYVDVHGNRHPFATKTTRVARTFDKLKALMVQHWMSELNSTNQRLDLITKNLRTCTQLMPADIKTLPDETV